MTEEGIIPPYIAKREFHWQRRHRYRQIREAYGTTYKGLAKEVGRSTELVRQQVFKAMREHEAGASSPIEIWLNRGYTDLEDLAKMLRRSRKRQRHARRSHEGATR